MRRPNDALLKEGGPRLPMSCSAVELVGRDADITTRPGLLQA
jgi:hypothetical protein